MGILRTNEISGLETPTAVTGSVVFDGTGDNFTVAASNDFEFEYEFTAEFWIYLNTITQVTYHPSPITFSQDGTNNGQIYLNAANKFFSLYRGSADIVTTGNNSVETGKWYHVAVTRDSLNVCRIFLDGIERGSATSTLRIGLATGDIRIGSFDASGNSVNGYISNLRILKGTALYTSDFTPPVHELQPIGDTVLLCCNNPDSAGAEATGKTITVNGNAAASTVSPGLTRDFTFGTQFQGVAKFDTQGYFVPPSGTTEQRGRGRGIFGGGYGPNVSSPGYSNTIQYISIQSQGISQDFGDLSDTIIGKSACASSTRGVFSGGFGPGTSPQSTKNVIEYVNISTTGNAQDFGGLTQAVTTNNISCSSSTRGLIAGGITPSYIDSIEYITIASIGNSQYFGDLQSKKQRMSGCSSPTRGIFVGGFKSDAPPVTYLNVIDYVTIASTGDAQDFGDLTQTRDTAGGCSSSTRGVFAGGYTFTPFTPTATSYNNIDYITIASTGNAIDFGDLNDTNQQNAGCSNSTRGIFGGGRTPTIYNNIYYVTIASTGNSQDFGDLYVGVARPGACSDSHGGLS